MLNKVRLLKKPINMCAQIIVMIFLGIIEAFVVVLLGYPKFLGSSCFLICPKLSFYPKTIRAIGYLKSLRYTRHTLSGNVQFSSLRKGNVLFASLAQSISEVYALHECFDRIRLERTERFFIGVDGATEMPIYSGGEHLIVLLRKSKIVKKIPVDEDFSVIRRKLNDVAKKRLAILAGIIVFVAIVIGAILR